MLSNRYAICMRKRYHTLYLISNVTKVSQSILYFYLSMMFIIVFVLYQCSTVYNLFIFIFDVHNCVCFCVCNRYQCFTVYTLFILVYDVHNCVQMFVCMSLLSMFHSLYSIYISL